MKKFNRKLIRGTNWALAGLLSLLGFSGCDKIFQMEYGSPSADFKVTGRVTDEEGRPLSGVRIVAPNVDGVSRPILRLTTRPTPIRTGSTRTATMQDGHRILCMSN